MRKIDMYLLLALAALVAAWLLVRGSQKARPYTVRGVGKVAPASEREREYWKRRYDMEAQDGNH